MTNPKIVTVTLENRPGTLAQVAKLLGKENINIDAVECNALGELGFVRLVTTNPDKAERVLKNKGYSVLITDVVEATVANKPGELGRICEALSEAGVNIENCLGTTTGTGGDATLFFRVDKPDVARRVLQTATRATAMAR